MVNLVLSVTAYVLQAPYAAHVLRGIHPNGRDRLNGPTAASGRFSVLCGALGTANGLAVPFCPFPSLLVVRTIRHFEFNWPGIAA